MEESLLEVTIATGNSLETIADMDALSFLALAEVVARVQARHKYEHAWTAMMAAQGTKEGMEKLTKQWQPKADPKQDSEKFLGVLASAGISGGF